MTDNDVADLSEECLEAMVSAGKRPLIIDIYAPWCAPCRAGAPNFAKVARENADAADFVKVNLDLCERLGDRWAIRALPTVLVVRNGDVVWRSNDLRSSTLAQAVAEAREECAPVAPPPFDGDQARRDEALAALRAAIPAAGEHVLNRQAAEGRWSALTERAGGVWQDDGMADALPELVTDLLIDASATALDDHHYATFAVETLEAMPAEGVSPDAMRRFYQSLIHDELYGAKRLFASHLEIVTLLDSAASAGSSATMHHGIAEDTDLSDEDRLLIEAAVQAASCNGSERLASFARQLRFKWLANGSAAALARPEYAEAKAESDALSPRMRDEFIAGASEIDRRTEASADERMAAKRQLNAEIRERFMPPGSASAQLGEDMRRIGGELTEQQAMAHRRWLDAAWQG